MQPFAFGSLFYFNEQEAIPAATSGSPLLPPTSGRSTQLMTNEELRHDTTLHTNVEMRANEADDNVRSEFSKVGRCIYEIGCGFWFCDV